MSEAKHSARLVLTGHIIDSLMEARVGQAKPGHAGTAR